MARRTWPGLTTVIFSMAGELKGKMRSIATLPAATLRTIKVLLAPSPRKAITIPSKGVAWTLPALGSRVVIFIRSPTLKTVLAVASIRRNYILFVGNDATKILQLLLEVTIYKNPKGNWNSSYGVAISRQK